MTSLLSETKTESAPKVTAPPIQSHEDLPAIPYPIIITEKAAEMVKTAMEQEGLKDHALRIGVLGGGCSGLQYLLDFSEAPTETDFVAEFYGIPTYIDPYSSSHLEGTVIDYVDGLHGSGFKFENPNIVRSCGCGSSFQT